MLGQWALFVFKQTVLGVGVVLRLAVLLCGEVAVGRTDRGHCRLLCVAAAVVSVVVGDGCIQATVVGSFRRSVGDEQSTFFSVAADGLELSGWSDCRCGSCSRWSSCCCSWQCWWCFAGCAAGGGAVSDVGVVAEEGAGGVGYWISGRRW